MSAERAYVEVEIRVRYPNERTRVFTANKVTEPRMTTDSDLVPEPVIRSWSGPIAFGRDELDVTLTFTALVDDHGIIFTEAVLP